MQKGHAAAALVRNRDTSLCANQPHSQSTRNPHLIQSDLQSLTSPAQTPQQINAALGALRLFGEEKIFNCLAILRSIEPGYRYRPGRGGISHRQFEALSTLKDYGDSDISAWLASNRLSIGGVGRQRTSARDSVTSNPPVFTAPGHLRQPSANPSLRSSTSSLAPSAVFSNNSSYGTPRSSLSNDISLPELPEDICCNEESAHAHWCTYGEHHKKINTCEGWKRHEREHEVPYLCMPNGPMEHTPHGTQCALCFKEDPDQEHLARHNISICIGKFGEPLKKSRKTDMIAHLAKHRIHSKDAAALADQWRYPLNKKYFSCGFCVGIFYSTAERFSHIDNEHWKIGHTMDGWELSNCIKGLLLEPRLQAAWRHLLRFYPTIVESNLRWEKPLAEALQLRLEKAEEHPQILAKMALEFSSWGQNQPSQKSMAPTACRDQVAFSPFPAASQRPAATMSSRSTNSANQPQTGHMQGRVMFSQISPGALPSEDVEASSMDFPTSPYEPPTTPSALLNGTYQPDGFGGSAFWQQGPLMDLDTDDSPSQLALSSALSTEWSSMDTDHVLDDSPRIREHLMESGALLMSQLSPAPARSGQPAANAIVNRQGQDKDPQNGVSASNSGRLPTSNFSRSGTIAQQSSLGDEFDFLNKPLPPKPLDLPRNGNRAVQPRQNAAMDFVTGSNHHRT